METILNTTQCKNKTGRQVTVIPAIHNELCASNVSVAKKIKVAAYARVSTDYDEQQSSYEMQVNYYTKYIKEHAGWEFVNVYADEGVSGLRIAKRESFNSMITDALAGKIDLIITKSVSRFARNTVDSLTTIRTLKEHGVECYFEKENIWTLDSKGELLLTIMSSIAQEESRSISENVRWGKRKGMEDGKVSVSYSKFLGYKRGADGGLEIDEEQAVIVRRIFSMYLQGYNITRIAKILTEEGIATPFGKSQWKYYTVQRILKNEKYKGDALLQKYYVADFLTKKLVKNKGELKQYYVKENHEAIIEPEIFDQVQRLLAEGGKGKRQCSTSILSSKIICGDCGGIYGSKVWHSNDKYRKVVWQCNDKFKDTKCSTPYVTEEQIKALFVKAVNSLVRKREEIISDYNDILNVQLSTEKLEERQKSIKFEMEKLELDISKLVELNNTTDKSVSSYKEKRNEIINRYDSLNKLNNDILTEINSLTVRKETIRRFWVKFEEIDFISEFDSQMWTFMLEKAIVYSKENVLFIFRDGSEISVAL
ncbi:MAG: recombinase family protein [Ruminococcus sp.]|nr:recombinase family protein [Ruminococcus sp.]